MPAQQEIRREPGHLGVLLVPGPPFGGATWAGVLRRLQARGQPAQVLDVLAGEAEPTGLAGMAASLAEHTRARPTVVVAHYTAVPVALAAARAAPPAGLVLTNGPIHHLDPVTALAAALARGAPAAARAALHPRILRPWLASSAGLRRAVANPYVMDRDMIVAITHPALTTPAGRRATVALLRDLPRAVEHPPSPATPCLLAWGAADPLHPLADADEAMRWLPGSRRRDVPGGHLFHPVEHPWALADIVLEWLATRGLAPGGEPPDRDKDVAV